ncbi:MAG: TIGR04282 family arsenosugar biosynthesis glycosyltransferase [Candidatus Helarchaeota archaeon]
MTNTLIVFGKLPIRGLVKTRLVSEFLTEELVVELYECFLIDTLKLALKTNFNHLYWAIYPENIELAQKILSKIELPGKEKIILKIQQGSSFGERFYNISKDFQKAKKQNLVIIGTDIPHMQPSIINEAFRILRSEYCLVLGPNPKGGFYLLGHPNSLVIDSRDFFNEDYDILKYLNFAKENKILLFLLEEKLDIDFPTDLKSLFCILNILDYSKNFNNSIFFPKNTYNFLKTLKIKDF